MKISQQESSNEVKVYDVGSDVVLIDTPGLFGFKEQFNEEIHASEKYRDITKKYVSEAHLILYVMNSTNPIKDSHREELKWLFRDLHLLPRAVFVLSRFDEVADVEDADEYQKNVTVKQNNVISRLEDMIAINGKEISELAIVAVSANPWGKGTEYWLKNPDKFKQLSHIESLQQATTQKIQSNGGVSALVDETKKSVIQDVLIRQLPVAVAADEQIGTELAKLEALKTDQQHELSNIQQKITDAKISLRDSLIEYFTDLIMQAKGLDMETAGAFFDREIGSEGIIITTRLQNIFEREVKSVNFAINKVQTSFETEINHFNTTMMELGKQGLGYVLKSNLINNTTILAVRDGVVSIAKWVKVDLSQLLKFKPWGAVNLAKGLNGFLAVVQIATIAFEAYDEAKKQKEFREGIDTMVHNFEEQRQELLELINGPQFEKQFFGHYIALEEALENLQKNLEEERVRRQKFQAWRTEAESINKEFTLLSA